MSDIEDDDDGLPPVVQRQVSAAEAQPIAVSAASSAFNWRGPGQARGDDHATPALDHDEPSPCLGTPKPQVRSAFEWAASLLQSTAENAPMPKKPKAVTHRAHLLRLGSPQLQILRELVAGDLTREEVRQRLPKMSRMQFNNGWHNAKNQLRAVENDGTLSLTELGAQWVKANDPGAAAAPTGGNHAAATRPKKAAATPLVACPPPVDTSPLLPRGAGPQLRFALASDGSFWIAKNGVVINLDADEYAFMERYMSAAHMLRHLQPFGPRG